MFTIDQSDEFHSFYSAEHGYRPQFGLSSVLITPDASTAELFVKNYLEFFTQTAGNLWHITIFCDFDWATKTAMASKKHHERQHQVKEVLKKSNLDVPEMCLIFYNASAYGRNLEKINNLEITDPSEQNFVIVPLDASKVIDRPLFEEGLKRCLQALNDCMCEYRRKKPDYEFLQDTFAKEIEDDFLIMLGEQLNRNHLRARILRASFYVFSCFASTVIGQPASTLIDNFSTMIEG